MSLMTAADIVGQVRAHETWRAHCLNLIASENRISPAVRTLLDNDFVQRYGNYLGRDLTARRYSGNRYIQTIEVGLADIVRQTFGCREVELRAISGHVAGLAVIMATCRPGDLVVELAGVDGGHRLAAKATESRLIDLEIVSLPFNPQQYNVDAAATCQLIRERKPALVILGSSNFLFPHPVRMIAESLPAETVLAYDASHVFGLLACGEFQDPLREGAHVVFGSTHKTLPGPQGGLIIGNEIALMDAIGTAVYPAIVTNHHLMRSPALAVALLEMQAHPDYAQQVIANSRAFGGRLVERGVAVVAAERGISHSHTVLMQVAANGGGKAVARRLEEADILVSYTALPAALGGEGIRLGTAEVTRLGANESAMIRAADLVADVTLGSLSPTDAQAAVHAWAEQLPGLCYAAL